MVGIDPGISSIEVKRAYHSATAEQLRATSKRAPSRHCYVGIHECSEDDANESAIFEAATLGIQNLKVLKLVRIVCVDEKKLNRLIRIIKTYDVRVKVISQDMKYNDWKFNNKKR